MKAFDLFARPSQFDKLNLLNTACSDSETEIREFIASTFALHYNATIDTFCDRLLGVCSPEGQLCAAAGYNLAEEGPLFLEQYLDCPLEVHMQQQFGLEIQRTEIAEVGNLATTQVGGARMLIELMTQHLHAEGRRWVAFTATRSLINSFHKLGLSPVVLTPALPERVNNLAAWGTYYTQNPLVAIGDIQLGHSLLGGKQ